VYQSDMNWEKTMKLESQGPLKSPRKICNHQKGSTTHRKKSQVHHFKRLKEVPREAEDKIARDLALTHSAGKIWENAHPRKMPKVIRQKVGGKENCKKSEKCRDEKEPRCH